MWLVEGGIRTAIEAEVSDMYRTQPDDARPPGTVHVRPLSHCRSVLSLCQVRDVTSEQGSVESASLGPSIAQSVSTRSSDIRQTSSSMCGEPRVRLFYVRVHSPMCLVPVREHHRTGGPSEPPEVRQHSPVGTRSYKPLPSHHRVSGFGQPRTLASSDERMPKCSAGYSTGTVARSKRPL